MKENGSAWHGMDSKEGDGVVIGFGSRQIVEFCSLLHSFVNLSGASCRLYNRRSRKLLSLCKNKQRTEYL